MDEPVTMVIAGAVELALWCAGVFLIVRIAFSPARRALLRGSNLPPSPLSVTDFLLFLFGLSFGTVVIAAAASSAARTLGLRGDEVTVTGGAAAQLAMLAVYALVHQHAAGTSPIPTSPSSRSSSVLSDNVFLAGLQTFLIALPLLVATVRVWEYLLKNFGLPLDRQDLIGMFAKAESPLLVIVMVTLAIVIAPLTEELVFRAGLYRFLRTRVPRLVALLTPALFFAALHVNWVTYSGLASMGPLTALALVFSLAYEHTGRIGVVIVAHALFNLNTLLMIFSGAADAPPQ